MKNRTNYIPGLRPILPTLRPNGVSVIGHLGFLGAHPDAVALATRVGIQQQDIIDVQPHYTSEWLSGTNRFFLPTQLFVGKVTLIVPRNCSGRLDDTAQFYKQGFNEENPNFRYIRPSVDRVSFGALDYPDTEAKYRVLTIKNTVAPELNVSFTADGPILVILEGAQITLAHNQRLTYNESPIVITNIHTDGSLLQTSLPVASYSDAAEGYSLIDPLPASFIGKRYRPISLPGVPSSTYAEIKNGITNPGYKVMRLRREVPREFSVPQNFFLFLSYHNLLGVIKPRSSAHYLYQILNTLAPDPSVHLNSTRDEFSVFVPSGSVPIQPQLKTELGNIVPFAFFDITQLLKGTSETNLNVGFAAGPLEILPDCAAFLVPPSYNLGDSEPSHQTYSFIVTMNSVVVGNSQHIDFTGDFGPSELYDQHAKLVYLPNTDYQALINTLIGS